MQNTKYHDQERGKEHLCHPVGGRVVNHQVDEVKLPQKHCQHLKLTILEIPDLEKVFVASFVIFSKKEGFCYFCANFDFSMKFRFNWGHL